MARGDKVQQEVAWYQPVTLELEDQSLFSDQRICVAVYQKRQLWSTVCVCLSGGLSLSLRVRVPGSKCDTDVPVAAIDWIRVRESARRLCAAGRVDAEHVPALQGQK